MASNKSSTKAVKEDRWIPSACAMCYGMCSIKAHRVDGTIMKIEGNPESPISNGRLCGKGVSSIMTLYDPNRVNVPLKRTNPQKGIGVDPKWVEITWDEAMNTITERLKKIYKDDPRKLLLQGSTTNAHTMLAGMSTFAGAFGTHNMHVGGGGLHCGNGAHELNGLLHASWSTVPDFELCNYTIYFGASKGHSAGHVANPCAQKASDSRARGMRLVVVDPMCNFASGKANEWVPIRVGTDAALALSMANVMVNELDIYDREYLKRRTNGPYLVKPDGHYMRDEATNKPMMWDSESGAAKTFDDTTMKDPALLGAFKVNGVDCTTGFQLLKDHLKKYPPEEATKTCTVPANTIRRLAKEFGTNARVGSTIVIDGKTLPYRPVAAIFFRGSEGHKNSTYNCLSIDMLNHLVGCADVPGGALGFNPVCYGHPDTGRPYYVPTPCPDGLMITGSWLMPHLPYPPAEPAAPGSLGLTELFPMGMMSALQMSSDREELWKTFKMPYRTEMIINYGANSVMSVGNKYIHEEFLKTVDFFVSFDIILNETTDFADIVLPDTSFMERLDPNPNFPFIFNHPAGMGDWGWPIRQPLIEPVGQRRGFVDVMLELAHRVGISDPMNIAYNIYFKLQEPYVLKPGQNYNWTEISDRILRNNFGDDKGVEWFKEKGVITWPKKVEEVYWSPFVPVRIPIYYEFFQTLEEKSRPIAEKFGFKMDFSRHKPLPDWLPCPSHEVKDPQYDLWSFYYRDILHTNSFTMENPWLDEAAQMNPYSYFFSINADVAKKKGLKDGDMIWVESNTGRKIKGRVKLTEGIHPEGLGVAAMCGHWSANQPVARGKGIFYNDLIEVDYEHSDPANLNMDLCVKVKVYKAEER
ncbi:MAG: molybdopterin-dependent oxidoreductase [Dehalococcoidia bacterium]|nr:molybdopterin-dependent oxidoreductase [Dehalococcoidia bacterium]